MADLRAPGETSPGEWILPDPYEIVACLKESGRRRVLLLRDRQTDLRYVLKAVPASEKFRLMREYELLLKLHDGAFPHPAACFERAGRAYSLRVYVPGRSLAECVEDDGPFEEARAAEIAQKLCGIAERLHRGAMPVVHRDIKPHNLILSPDGSLHLVDMAAEALKPEKSEDTLVMGTAATAAPEQFGCRRCDERTDVYAIGMLLVFLMTGGYSAEALRNAGASGRMRRTVADCIWFDPSKRIQSAARLSARLSARRGARSGVWRWDIYFSAPLRPGRPAARRLLHPAGTRASDAPLPWEGNPRRCEAAAGRLSLRVKNAPCDAK